MGKGRNTTRVNSRRSSTNQILDRQSSLFEVCIARHTEIAVCVFWGSEGLSLYCLILYGCNCKWCRV